jgi:hypothetical protein
MIHNASKKKRIVIIQYGWTVQSYTRDIVIDLSDDGYIVTFFVDTNSLHGGLVDVSTFKRPGVEVVELNGPMHSQGRLLKRAVTRLRREALARLGSVLWFIDFADYAKITSWFSAQRPEVTALIGIEKQGFIFAGAVGSRYNIPYIYHSLELFFRDRNYGWHYQARLKHERQYHKHAAATIVQDNLRADALFAHNGIRDQKRILMPVGLPSVPPMCSTRYWHARFGLSDRQKVLLYFGDLTCSIRPHDKLLEAWSLCPPEYALVFHGNGDATRLLALCAEHRLLNVFVSTTLVPEKQIRDLIVSSDIGLCLYDNGCINERLTAFSSQKIALFLRDGIPVISNDNESYRKLFEEFMCGRSLASYQDIPAAVDVILKNHRAFTQEAKRAFETIYCNDVSFPKLHQFLASLDKENVCESSFSLR